MRLFWRISICLLISFSILTRGLATQIYYRPLSEIVTETKLILKGKLISDYRIGEDSSFDKELLYIISVEKIIFGEIKEDEINARYIHLYPDERIIDGKKTQDSPLETGSGLEFNVKPNESYIFLFKSDKPDQEQYYELLRIEPVEKEEEVSSLLEGQEIKNIEIIEWGEYAIPTKDITGKRQEEKSITGEVTTIDEDAQPELVKKDEQILAQLGKHFGIRFIIDAQSFTSEDVIPLRIRVLHPLIKNPKIGVASTEDEWDMPSNVGILRYTGWWFENEWELVGGEWTIQILYKDRVWAEKKFIIEPVEKVDYNGIRTQ